MNLSWCATLGYLITIKGVEGSQPDPYLETYFLINASSELNCKGLDK